MFTIVIYHFLKYAPLPPLLAKANLLGGSGIYIFLLASSYGLYFSKTTSWFNFYLKRFRKVLLPYYIGLTLIVLINHFVTIYPESWQAYVSHLLLYKMFYEPYMGSYGPHFWFISTIVQFYLVWPLLLKLSESLKTIPLLSLAFGISILYSVLIFKLGVQDDRIWHSSAIQYFWVFALGLAMAKEQWLPQLLRLGLFRYALLFVFGAGISLAINKFAGAQGGIFNDYFMFIAYFSACVILYLISQKIQLISRFVLWIESFSYSLYIVHLFVFSCYMKSMSETRISLYEVPIVLALAIGIALVFDKAVNLLLNLKLRRARPALGI